ncbi:hypothetical protein TrispH2_006780 [Trichoplax sp. H2]|nr:hypothetical protein TrispH2_006780 [Trichoplax sp. H2]|eukprot:RDD40366.1 hypothetical protein TrispH2_006780 [Trichoplax sp. H2]
MDKKLLISFLILMAIVSSSCSFMDDNRSDEYVGAPVAEKETDTSTKKLLNRIKKLKKKVKDLQEKVSIMSKSVTSNTYRIKAADKSVLLINQQLLNITGYIPAQFQKINRRIDQLSQQVISANGRLITRCRVCLLVTGPYDQCQGNRNTCSGWSTSPQYTQTYRDDTDHRSDGCYMRWKIECQ